MLPKQVDVALASDITAAVDRVRAGFIEMPGLRLTMPQASRLWALDQALCHEVVDVLVRGAFLRRTPSGLITRMGDTK